MVARVNQFVRREADFSGQVPQWTVDHARFDLA